MARLSQSQLAGFRIAADTPESDEPSQPERRRPPRRPATPGRRTESPSAPSLTRAANPSALGPVPAAPTRDEDRHKVGLSLPVELAQRVRDITQQGYGLADLVMVAYQRHRDELLEEHKGARTRELVRRDRGRSPLTVALSNAERTALDTLAQRLGWTRSRTVGALLEYQLAAAPGSDDG